MTLFPCVRRLALIAAVVAALTLSPAASPGSTLNPVTNQIPSGAAEASPAAASAPGAPAACPQGFDPADPPAAPAALSLKIGVLPAADSILLHAAAADGLFAAQGLDVELIPFQSALELGSAMRAGELDGHFGDIINVLLQCEAGADQAIVAVSSRSSPFQRHFGLALSPRDQARSLTGLEGADTAVAGASIVDYLLDRMLDQQGLPRDFFRRQDIRQIPVRLQMLLSGRLKAAMLPEPLLSLVEAQGARILWDDRGLDIPLAVIALVRARADAGTVRRFRLALAGAARRINARPGDYVPLMLDRGLLPRAALGSWRMLRFGDPAGAGGESAAQDRHAGAAQAADRSDALPSLPPLLPLPALPTEAELEDFAAWMRQGGMLKKMPDIPAGLVAP